MVFPVARFVNEPVKDPVNRVIVEPSADVLSSLLYSLLTGMSTWTGNAQKLVSGVVPTGRMKGSACRPAIRPPGPRRAPARPPPSLPGCPAVRLAPRSIQFASWRHPLRATARWPGAGHVVQPEDRRGGHSRPAPLYHSLGIMSIALYQACGEPHPDQRPTGTPG